MQYPHKPYVDYPPFAWWDDAFSDEQLQHLRNVAKSAKEEAGVGGPQGGVNPEVRRSKINWVHCHPDTEWVYHKLDDVIGKLNSQFYGFQLSGFNDAVQMTNYSSFNQGGYGWHQDFGSGCARKLSLVMQLSDPSSYEGGNLELMVGDKPTQVEKKIGRIIVFPAWTLHRVTPVTVGTRQTLVTWVSGDPFR
jgi:PKHD-type hydroxylase